MDGVSGFDAFRTKSRLCRDFAGIATSTDTDAAFGGFAKVGLDFFVTPKIALNAEFKGTLATEQDVKQNGVAGIKYDPSNFSGLFGVRFFFN